MKTATRIVCLLIVAIPQCFADGFREGTLYPASNYDLETGYSTHTGPNPGAKHDLSWGCGPAGIEYLRALAGVSVGQTLDEEF